MNKTKIWAGVLAVFAAGVIVGVVGGITYSRYDFEKRFDRFHKMPAGSIAKVILDKIDHEVSLTEKQRAEIEPLILEGAKKADKTMEATHQKMQQHLQELFDNIKTKLTEEQREKFDMAVKNGLLRPPGPPGPPGEPGGPPHGPPPPRDGKGPWQPGGMPPPPPPGE